MTQLLSGRVATRSPGQASSDRWSFLSLQDAEPNLGIPALTNSFLVSDDTGVRSWIEARLSTLKDISITNPGHGNLLIYNSATSKFENGNSLSNIYFDGGNF